MPTTSNFGWTTPADTDLVKDGAAAIRTLGNGIDASLLDLKGGTTGQILSKASNTDLDYTWINNDQGDITGVTAGTGLTGGGTSGTVTVSLDTTAVIQPTIVDAKGDIIAATGADAVARLAVGANNTVLTADSTTATGLKWATPSAPSALWTRVSAGDSLNGLTTFTYNTLGAYTNFLLVFSQVSFASATSLNIRPNNQSTTSTYYQARYGISGAASDAFGIQTGSSSAFSPADMTTGSQFGSGAVYIFGNKSSGMTRMVSTFTGVLSGANALWHNDAFVDLAAAITSITISGGTFTGGNVTLWAN